MTVGDGKMNERSQTVEERLRDAILEGMTPEEWLRDAIREGMTPAQMVEEAHRLIEEGEKLEHVLFLYPEFGEPEKAPKE